MFGVDRKILRKYADLGVIRSYRNPVNKYRYFEENELREDIKKIVIYSKE